MRGLVVFLAVAALAVVWGFYAQASAAVTDQMAPLQAAGDFVDSFLASLGLTDPNVAASALRNLPAMRDLAETRQTSIVLTVGILLVVGVVLATPQKPTGGATTKTTWRQRG